MWVFFFPEKKKKKEKTSNGFQLLACVCKTRGWSRDRRYRLSINVVLFENTKAKEQAVEFYLQS